MLTFKRKGNIFPAVNGSFRKWMFKKCAKTKYTQEGKRQLVKIKSTLARAKGAFLGNRLHLGHLRVWRYVTYIISKTIVNKYLSLFIIAKEDSVVKNNSNLPQNQYIVSVENIIDKARTFLRVFIFYFTCDISRNIFPPKQMATINNRVDIEYPKTT